MQINHSELKLDRGDVIGIGRVKIPRMSDFNYEIPLLSFVLIKTEDDRYVSSCIHMQIDGYGKTEEDAQIDMIDNILCYLAANFNNEKYNKHCWTNMLRLFEANEDSSALWDKYHAFQLMLAENGQNADRFSHSQLLKELIRRIDELENKIKELEKANVADSDTKDINKFINIVKSAGKMAIVQYIPIHQGPIHQGGVV